jgi:hypothetical protein
LFARIIKKLIPYEITGFDISIGRCHDAAGGVPEQYSAAE